MDQLHGLPTGGNGTLVPEHGMSHQSHSMLTPIHPSTQAVSQNQFNTIIAPIHPPIQVAGFPSGTQAKGYGVSQYIPIHPSTQTVSFPSNTPIQAYEINKHQANIMMAPTSSPTQTTSLLPYSSFLREQHPAPNYIRQQQEQHQLEGLQHKLYNFWANQYQEIQQIANFRSHAIPLAKIKKIMKSDEKVKLVSAESPIIFAKACEIFIMELTMRAWGNVEKNKRTTLRSNDMAVAITGSHVFDFLHDVIPSNDAVDYKMYADILRGDITPIGNTSYNYMSPRHVVGPPSPLGMITERPVPDQSHDEQQILPF
ncbi:hypothetical protein RIF29_18885 [Crotalaria pallida]|uniref:Core Histone H2A/H2B/H3 domain-containing protein n=1 Tax=Crotalaria pallida TaxID=3830 RepID=A0AAN9I3M7_CROPI